jgi:hypothetical protein
VVMTAPRRACTAGGRRVFDRNVRVGYRPNRFGWGLRG